MNYKIILYGSSDSGAKTSLLYRIAYDKFIDNFPPTIGFDFKLLNIETKFGIIKFLIWDCAGQERFRNVVASYFKGVNCIILGYDITNKNSFDYTKKSCFDYIIKNIDKNNIPLLYLVANKIDLGDKIKIPDKDAISFAKEKQMKYFKVSAKTGQGVDLLLNHIANSLIKKYIHNYYIKKGKYFKLIRKGDKEFVLIEDKNKKFLLLGDKIDEEDEEDVKDFIKLNKYYNY